MPGMWHFICHNAPSHKGKRLLEIMTNLLHLYAYDTAS